MRFTFNLRKLGTGAEWPSSIPRRLSSNLQRADLTVLKIRGVLTEREAPFTYRDGGWSDDPCVSEPGRGFWPGGSRVRSKGLQEGVCFEIHQESLLLVGKWLKEVSLSTSSRALWEHFS